MTSTAFAWMTPRNPDLRPSFGFQAGGGTDVNASQTKTASPGSPSQTRSISNQSLDFTTDALFPVTDAVSLQAGGGLTSDQSSSEPTPLLAGSSLDRTSATAFLLGRYFFLDHSLTGSAPQDNPDQWPSITLMASGADSIYRQQTDILSGNKVPREGSLEQSITFSEDTRLPVANAWTLLLNLAGTMSRTEVKATATANGTETRDQRITYGGGFRYYWVGKNFIAQDEHTNPDRWLSTQFIADGIQSVNSHQTITTSSSGTDIRDTHTTGYSLSMDWRFPLTNNLTFRIGMSGGQTRQTVPMSTQNAGSITNTPTFSGFAGIRGYFF